jgi:hypothetical protein
MAAGEAFGEAGGGGGPAAAPWPLDAAQQRVLRLLVRASGLPIVLLAARLRAWADRPARLAWLARSRFRSRSRSKARGLNVFVAGAA